MFQFGKSLTIVSKDKMQKRFFRELNDPDDPEK